MLYYTLNISHILLDWRHKVFYVIGQIILKSVGLLVAV